MKDTHADAVVIGAGVVGIAVARIFAICGLETILIEQDKTFGTGTSSRNSEVIHAGLYYKTNSLKADLCISGRTSLYKYCSKRDIPHKQIGKYVVATSSDDIYKLEKIYDQARLNGCKEVNLLTPKQIQNSKGELDVIGILDSPLTGIIDSHQLMLSLLGDFENAGGVAAWNTKVKKIKNIRSGIGIEMNDGYQLGAEIVVNCSGLSATDLISKKLSAHYSAVFARGDYYSYSKSVPFDKLIYPIPEKDGLGIHLTLDLSGRGRFGPDVTWIDSPKPTVDKNKEAHFANSIRRYWPNINHEHLMPEYAGVRPKIKKNGILLDDFEVLQDPFYINGQMIHLLGIESPGLTCCLSLGEHVLGIVK